MDPRILQFLLFAALFYFMMRFGCGSHMVHGHHHDEGHDGKAAGAGGASSVDPVCGMQVEAGKGYAEVFAGREYRFCSRKCLDQFDANPEQFAHQ
jgi:YHS domain-containing protein